MPVRKKNTCPVPSGKLLIIGGAENKGEEGANGKETPKNFIRLEILKKLVDLTNKKNPAIELITSATTSPEESVKEYKKVFQELKVSNFDSIHHKTRKEVLEDPELLKRIQRADAIFFAGGDQLLYTHLYGGTDFLTALKERYIRDKVVIAGTSAGAMALSTPMIYAGNDEVQEIGGMIKVTTGLEFLKDVCIDTHFVHRGRVIRMAQVITTNPGCIGMGIEEDTALIIRNGLEVEVIGTGTVVIIDGFHIEQANVSEFTKDKPISIRDLKLHILSEGDLYKLPQLNPPHV